MAIATMTISQAKAQAKALRLKLAQEGQEISHAKSLELIAGIHGARDWNTLHARLGEARLGDARLGEGDEFPFSVGSSVSGRYLKQPFTGEVVGVSRIAHRQYRVEIYFDEAVDVVQFDGFSNMRRRIRSIVGSDGVSPRKTSDGVPHLTVNCD